MKKLMIYVQLFKYASWVHQLGNRYIYIQTTQVIAFVRDPGYKKSFKNTTSVVVRLIVFYDILKYAYPLQCFVICSIKAFIAKGAYQKGNKILLKRLYH